MNTLSNGWRLLWSFVVAFVLWMFVTLTQNPEANKIFDVPVQIKNLPANAVIVDENGIVVTNYGTVSVDVWAAKDTLNQIRDVDLQAIVDLGNVDDVRTDVDASTMTVSERFFPVTVLPSRDNLGFVTFKELPQVGLRIDEMQTSELPIEIDKRSYAIANIAFDMPNVAIVSPLTSVQIEAPRMLINRIKQAKVIVAGLANATASYEGVYPVVVVDDADQPISGVTLVPDTVSVKVEVRAKLGSKQVLIKPQTRGYVAPGYRLREIRVNPALVSISGGYEYVDAISSVATVPIDISNLSETITQTVQIVVPENISLYEYDQQNKMTVDVGFVIEKDVQPTRLRIPVVVELTDVPDGMTVQVSPSIVIIEVLMSPAALQRGALTQVQAVVAVGQWDAANSTRQAVLLLPKDIELIGGNPTVQLSAVEVEVATPQVTVEATQTDASALSPTVTPSLTMTVTPTKAGP